MNSYCFFLKEGILYQEADGAFLKEVKIMGGLKGKWWEFLS